MKYFLDCSDIATQFIRIQVEIHQAENGMQLHLPTWRPGRYEAANYARFVRDLQIQTMNGEPVLFKKVNSSCWEIQGIATEDIVVTYEFYAAELNAGSTRIDEGLIYINFINCLIYNSDRQHLPCEVRINIPEDYTTATSLTVKENNTWTATDYYELVDSPILSASVLNHYTYTSRDIPFHIWIYGETSLEKDLVIADFKRFSDIQIDEMGDFPEKEYHFLLITAPYKLYHGVEHASSTVICLGPGNELGDQLYDQLLGISSHELFHAWNVIKIRPKELLPYRFHNVPVFDTGFVAEGFTTYLGDLFLVRSGVRDEKWFLNELSVLLQRHFENHGRLHTSVAESSVDLWIDGYRPGAPHRKSSIYVEGAVIGLLLDLKIRSVSKNQASLITLMRILYQDFAKHMKGYTAENIQYLAEQLINEPLDTFFSDYVTGTRDTRPLLDRYLSDFGLKIVEKKNGNPIEQTFGVRMMDKNGIWKVVKIMPGSPSEKILHLNDEIIQVNGHSLGNEQLTEGEMNEAKFKILRQGTVKILQLKSDGNSYLPTYEIQINGTSGKDASRRGWLSAHV